MAKETIYQQNGYENRREYLEELAENYGIHISTVLILADMLGPSEDFDGLVSTLEDTQEIRALDFIVQDVEL